MRVTSSGAGAALPELRQALHDLRAGLKSRCRRSSRRTGRRADFEPAKLRASMLLALRKRPVSIEQIDAAHLRIEEKLLASGARELASTRLGELVMRELKRIDKVAYVRFASVYRSFEDVDEFRQLIRDI
jgi:transcriptional repressor NrdR